MGYDLHITRAEDWVDSEQHPISLDEWLDYLRLDPEMQLTGLAEVRLKDGTIFGVKSEGLAVWMAYSKHDPSWNQAWFDYQRGEVKAKNPDDEIIGKMKKIAAYFNARVIGDDGEEY